jgi:hypothetical protein
MTKIKIPFNVYDTLVEALPPDCRLTLSDPLLEEHIMLWFPPGKSIMLIPTSVDVPKQTTGSKK